MERRRRERREHRNDRSTWNYVYKQIHSSKAQEMASGEIEALLNQLMTLTLPTPRIPLQDCSIMFTRFCRVIPIRSELLCSELFHFLQRCQKDQMLVYSTEQLHSVIPFCVGFLSNSSTWYAPDALNMLGSVLFEHPLAAVAPFYEWVVALIIPYLDPSAVDVEAKLAATICAANLYQGKPPATTKGRGKQKPTRENTTEPDENFALLLPHALRLFQVLLENLRHQVVQIDNGDNSGTFMQTCKVTLEAIYNILEATDSFLRSRFEVHLTSLLACVRQLIGRKYIQEDAHLYSPIRVASLKLLRLNARLHPHHLNTALALYLPEGKSVQWNLYGDKQSILTLLLFDTENQVRLNSTEALQSLIEGLPVRRLTTRSSPARSGFTSLSEKLSKSLQVIHFALGEALSAEKEGYIVEQILKTISVLFQCCPYRKIYDSELKAALKTIFDECQALLWRKDHSLRVASLSCLAALFGSNEPLGDGSQWLTGCTGRNALDEAQRPLLDELLELAVSDAAVRLETMALLTRVVKKYPQLVGLYWERFSRFFVQGFRDDEQNVRLQAVKVVENFIRGAAAVDLSIENSPLHTEQCLRFLREDLLRAFQDVSHHVRAGVCASYSALSESDWKELREIVPDMASLIKTFAESIKDDSPVVRASAYRLLGSLSMINSFKTPWFCNTVIKQSFAACTDTTLNVRVKSCWCISNICNSPGPDQAWLSSYKGRSVNSSQVFTYNEGGERRLIEVIAPDTLYDVTVLLVDLVNDNDKVACSAVRALGCIGQWIGCPRVLQLWYSSSSSQEILHSESNFQSLLETVMLALAKKISEEGPPKLKWNSCYAISKVLSTIQLPLASVSWAPTVFTNLVLAVLHADNFKVRINAAVALRAPESRTKYSSSFIEIFGALCHVLESTDEMHDFSDFKYKDQLELQLVNTLTHLLSIAVPEDREQLVKLYASRPASTIERFIEVLFPKAEQHTLMLEEAHSRVPMLTSEGNDPVDLCDAPPLDKEKLIRAYTFMSVVLLDLPSKSMKDIVDKRVEDLQRVGS